MSGTPGHSGGARIGSGRKPANGAATRVYISARIDPATHSALKAEQAKGDSLGIVLDRIVGEWLAAQP